MKLDPKTVRDQITNLLLCNPELEEDEVLRADMIEGSTDVHEFLSQLVRCVAEAEHHSTALNTWAISINVRSERFNRRIDNLRKLIKQIMDDGGLKKVPLPEATLSIRNGSPKVIITNEHELGDGWMRIKKEPDKTRIKAALMAGEHVNGAALSNSESTLAILIR